MITRKLLSNGSNGSLQWLRTIFELKYTCYVVLPNAATKDNYKALSHTDWTTSYMNYPY